MLANVIGCGVKDKIRTQSLIQTSFADSAAEACPTSSNDASSLHRKAATNITSMASEIPPVHPGTGDQPQIEDQDEPPAYDEATETLDVRHDGVNTKAKVGSGLLNLICLRSQS
jgi:hypothetical protein